MSDTQIILFAIILFLMGFSAGGALVSFGILSHIRKLDKEKKD